MLDQLYATITYLPPFEGYGIFYYIFQAILFLIVFNAIRIAIILLTNKTLAVTSDPYSSKKESSEKILILGDSTAVGTGASKPEDTIGGMLARDFPNAQIVNVGVNGSTVSDLPRQIARVADQKFNLIVISSGGNDTWKFSRMETIRNHLYQVLMKAISLSDHQVVFLVNNNVGFGPFPKFISAILTRRARKITEIIESVAIAQRIPVIDLFSSDRDNPFLKNPTGLLASDGIHPSSEGYAVWYRRMWRELVAQGYRYQRTNTKSHL